MTITNTFGWEEIKVSRYLRSQNNSITQQIQPRTSVILRDNW